VALASATALLKKRRDAAILFSRSESSFLQLLEILVGLQVRIGFGEGKELAQRALQLPLGQRLGCGTLSGDGGVASLDEASSVCRSCAA